MFLSRIVISKYLTHHPVEGTNQLCDSTVGTGRSYGLVGRVRFLLEAREFPIFRLQTGPEAHPVGAGGSSSGGKATGTCI